MAKVQGPLMSLDASGTVANTATFSKWKGRNYVRTRVVPHNPQSAAQTAVRANFAGLVASYRANTSALNTAFKTRADQKSISPFNAFVGFNQSRATAGHYPANSDTPTNAAPANNATGLAAVVVNRTVSLTWTDPVAADAWLVAVYRKLGADPTGVQGELVAMVPRGTQQFQDGPLVPGAWHYVVRGVSTHGGATAVSAAVVATVS